MYSQQGCLLTLPVLATRAQPTDAQANIHFYGYFGNGTKTTYVLF